jgi:hypothetical protein
MRRTLVHCVVLLVLGLVLAACAPSSTQGPATWLDQPLDGARLPLGPQEITAHASDTDGVSGFEFYVDGTILVSASAGGGELEHATVGWNPTRPGVYTVGARATDGQGNVGAEARAVVTVGEVASPPPPSPSMEAASSPMPATATAPPPSQTAVPPTATPPPPTMTPRPPTQTPVPPTSTPPPPSPTTPPPPTIVSFQANPAQIQEGGCTTLSWRVEGGPTEIYFDGEGATSPDSRQRCPTQTTSYTLVARGPGGEVSQSLSVTVIVDDQGPRIANVQQSTNSVYCLEQPSEIEISARVTDPSGVRSVELYCNLDGGGEVLCRNLSRSGNRWSATYIPQEHAICYGTMQYRIKATDDSARGNVSWWGTGSFDIYEY